MKIKYLNKKLLTVPVAFTFVTCSIVGCAKIPVNNISYETSSDGQISATGTIDYKLLKEYYFVEIQNSDFDLNEYYIARKYANGFMYSNVKTYSYTDILTGVKVFCREDGNNNYWEVNGSNSNRVLAQEIKLEDYLYTDLKESYSVEDIENIKNNLKENYSQKSLVKE